MINLLDSKSYQKEEIVVKTEFLDQLSSQISDGRFYKVLVNNQIVNTLYVGQAPSHVSQFDYMVVFDKNHKIVFTKVLIYREDYGFEITSRRWLKQFLGKSTEDQLVYKKDIDAISGATISANSMTKEMNLLLKAIKTLKQNNAI